MRLNQRAPGKLVFTGRRAVRPAIWIGVAFLVGPASLALFAPGPLTGTRILSALVFGGIGLTFVASAWPRVQRVVVEIAARVVRSGERQIPWTKEAVLHLVPVEPRTPGGRPVYGIALAPRADAERVLLVATTDPGDAARDLAALQKALAVPVHGGWGLPESAPWIDAPADAAPDSPFPVHRTTPNEERGARRRASTALLVGSVAISFGVARTVFQRLDLGQPPGPLSLVLPGLGVTALAIIGGALATSETTLQVGDALVCERRLFGVVLQRKTIARTSIRAAYLVSPDGSAPRHLLVDTDEGPRAFPYQSHHAAHVASLLS